MNDATALAERVASVRDRIEGACRDAGRPLDAVTLVAVTKTVGIEVVRAAYDLGLRIFGENRAQDLRAKSDVLAGDCSWHMIGAVQTNKVRLLAGRVAMWESVDREQVVDEIARRDAGARVLVEVNIAGEAQKHGCAPDDVARLVDHARRGGLHVRGLMCVPPFDDDPAPHFARLRELAAREGLDELSMGMSNDFEVAIREGATLVRVGTALFGPRPPRGLARD